MTEAEWLAATDPTPILAFLKSNASDRKTRLFQVACCRRFWHLLDEPHCRKMVEVGQLLGCTDLLEYPLDSSRKAIEVAELAADEPVSTDEMAMLSDASFRFQFVGEYYCACYDEGWGYFDGELVAAAEAACAAHSASSHYLQPDEVAFRTAQVSGYAQTKVFGPPESRGCSEERNFHCHLLRDLFGNPFHPVAFVPEWRTSTVISLAQSMYKSRDFSTMPILSDALQDADCDNEDILNHCRSDSPHVRGCWVVDLILGKE